jgi:hypothetical protein
MNPQAVQRCRRVRTYSGAEGAGTPQIQQGGALRSAAGAAVGVSDLTKRQTRTVPTAFHVPHPVARRNFAKSPLVV